ncbi:MAG: hypothetical protein ACOCP3_02615 [Halodesulfurarchaeum sp.]
MADETFDPGVEWLEAVIPEGIPLNRSTVISGPGGSGKPLIGFAILDAWLEAGGEAVVLLSNSDAEFVYETMDLLYETERQTIDGQATFVDFDPEREPTVEAMETPADGPIAGNLLEPAVWRSALEAAIERSEDSGPGTLLFGTALNLFLFSDTYREGILAAFEETVERRDVTGLFTVSSSAYAEKIGRVEAAANTVLMTEMDEETLRLRGERSEQVELEQSFVEVPFTPEELDRIRTVAESSRDELLPTIRSV